MQFMPFGKTGKQVSRLGFGMMRLPTVSVNGKSVIDREEAIRMLRRGIDGGVNYVDTAYVYHGGESEVVTGLGLKGGYRDKVMLTTKMPVWLVENESDMDRYLDEQLARLDVSTLDFFILHSLNAESFRKMQKMNYRRFYERARADGRIRFTGFSFHDGKDAFPPIIDDYDWGMAQIQFNYLDDGNQATLEGLLYAQSRGIPIVVMEPLRGGALANPPQEIRDMMEMYPRKRSPVEWAFRYVGHFPGVATILSGMNTMEQVEDNLRIFANVSPENLSDADLAFVRSLKQRYLGRVGIGCTGCNYCQPCPQGVQIPRIFEMYNESFMLGNDGGLKWNYRGVIRDKADGSLCVECGQCEAVCPQGLSIIETLKLIDAKAR